MVDSYILIDITCMLILLFVLCKSYRHNILIKKVSFFYLSLILSFLLCLTDIFIGEFDGKSGKIARNLVYIFNMFYMIFSCLSAYSWTLFTFEKINRDYKFNYKLVSSILFIPCLIMIILSILSLKYSIIFYVDENNFYVRGKYHICHSILLFVYLLISSISCFLFSLKIKNNYLKKEYLSLSLFVIPSIVAGIVQLIAVSLPAIPTGIAIGFLIVYVDETERRAYVDILTGLNNRYKLMVSYKNILKNIQSPNKLYLIIADINSFKQINDQYGHLSGDMALSETAEAFKQCCEKDFVARYGGDEFIVLYKCKNEEEIESLLSKIDKYLNFYNDLRGKDSYKLALTYGYSVFDEKSEKINDVIAKADKMLYSKKRQ